MERNEEMKGLYFKDFGDSDVLRYGELDDPQINQNELLIQMKYAGLNFADIYRRRGNYHIEKHDPYINGYEGVGTIVEAGNEATNFKVGETILFVDVPFSNAELVKIPQQHAIAIPKELDLESVASIGLQGLTADFLAHDLGKNIEGDRVFIHGISGGVGQILSQMLKADGMSIYGVTSSVEKKELAMNQGANEVFLRADFWVDENKNTFDTVYDGVGVTLNQSIQLTKKKGKVVLFGMAGGNPPQVDFIDLLTNSKSILTGDLWDYLTSYEDRKERSSRLFRYFIEDKINVSKPTLFSLADGKKAHDYLESGKSAGKVLLVP